MILQIIVPQRENFHLQLSVPKNYLGKEVYCVFYIKEEATKMPVRVSSKQRPSDFFGILTKEEGEKFENHIRQIRGQLDKIHNRRLFLPLQGAGGRA